MGKQSEKRSSGRLHVPLVVKYILSDKSNGKVIANNISITGVCLLLSQKLNIGTELILTIEMPGKNRETVIYGKVVWQKKSEESTKEGYITGLDFIRIDPLDIEKIIDSVKTGQYFISGKPPLP